MSTERALRLRYYSSTRYLLQPIVRARSCTGRVLQQLLGAHDDAQEAGWTHDQKLANRKSRDLEARQKQRQRSKSKVRKRRRRSISIQFNQRAEQACARGSRGVISSALVEFVDCSAGGEQRQKRKKTMETGWMPLSFTNKAKARTLGGMAWPQKDKVPTMENAYVGPPGM